MLLNGLKNVRAALIECIVIALFVVLVIVAWRTIREPVVTIEPLSVPKVLQDRGNTPEILTQLIISEFRAIEHQARMNAEVGESVSRLTALALAQESSLPDLQLPGTEFSLKAMIRYFKLALGARDLRAGGGVFDDWSVRIWLSDGRTCVKAAVSDDDQDIGRLAARGAQCLMGEIAPCYLASRLYMEGKAAAEEAEDLAVRCLARAERPEEKVAAYMVWAMIRHYIGDDADALRKYARAERVAAPSPALFVAWGNVHYSLKQFDEASQKYDRALELDHDHKLSRWIRMNRGLVFYERHDYKRAIDEYQDALDTPEDGGPVSHSLVFTNLGNAVRDASRNDLDQLEKAADYYNRAIDADPRSARAYNGLGSVHLRNAERADGASRKELLDDALREFGRSKRLDPGFPDAFQNAGNAYLMRGETKVAIGEFREAVKRAQGSADAHSDLGRGLLDDGDYRGAVEEFEKAKGLDPHRIHPYIGLGRAYTALGDLDRATVELKGALRLDPDSVDAHVDLGEAFLKRHERQCAAEQFQKARDLKPSLFHTGYARALMQMKQWDAASKQLTALDPLQQSAYVSTDWGDLNAAQGKYAEAIERYRQAVRLGPDIPFPYAGLGRVAERQGRDRQAVNCFRLAIDRRHPESVELESRIAALERRRKRTVGKWADQTTEADCVPRDTKDGATGPDLTAACQRSEPDRH